MIIALAAILVLLLLSAFFSGSETALTGASTAFMADQAKNPRNIRAGLLTKLFRQRDNLIITTMLGASLCNTLAASLSAAVFIKVFGNLGVAYSAVIITFLILIYTDMLPKGYAVTHANKTALSAAPIIYFFVKLFSPFVWALHKIINITFRIFNIHKENPDKYNISDVRGTISLYNDSKFAQEKDMLESILDLTDVEVYDVMNHRKNLFALDIDLPIEQILEKVKNCPFSRLPLYKDRPENIVGVIRIKTLFKEAIEKQGRYDQIKLEEIMTPPWFIPDNTSLMQQLQLFRKRREHFAIVVDEYGDLQGIVTLEDILEEIVGDINDESDITNLDSMAIRRHSDGSYTIDGQVPIRDLNRKFGWEINDENAVTIAGYLLDMTQSIPEPGQKFIFDGFRFEILKRSKNQITLVRVTKL